MSTSGSRTDSPSGEGSRIAALELHQLDITHTVIPDSAIGWLFANRRVDAVALRGDTVANNGDTVDAARRTGRRRSLRSDSQRSRARPRAAASWDRPAPDASDLVLDMRSAAELGSAGRARLNPSFDVVPARLVSAYVSERAVVTPPFKEPR